MKTYVGIDWSRDQHQVNIYNEQGARLYSQQISHSKKGFGQLHAQLQQLVHEASSCVIAIETQHNQLVDFLLGYGYCVYIIAPSLVKGNRSRQSNAGAKSDDKDAALLADILRTDQQRLIPWRPNSLLVRQMSVQIGVIDDLTTGIVRGHNRLQAHLLRYFPQGASVFSELTTQIALQLLLEYPSPSAVLDLDYHTFVAFCKRHCYKHTKQLPKRFARLKQSNPYHDLATEAAYAGLTPLLAKRLLDDVQRKTALLKELRQRFFRHPDAFIFDSLPGAGKLLAPKLLTILGDQRTRFPSPDFLRSLAGTSPVTQQSGRKRIVRFRRACNLSWRNTLQQFAKASISESAWASNYFEAACLRGLSDSHAFRCLANRWLGIIWTLWQRRLPYDEAVHWQHLQRHKRPFAK